MPKSRTLAVELTDRQLADLNAAVEAGQYPTTTAIVHEAISDWQIRHMLDESDIQRLRELWDEGRSDGNAPRGFDIQRILASARSRRTSRAAE
jgi:antitoxin ParD1/3/4